MVSVPRRGENQRQCLTAGCAELVVAQSTRRVMKCVQQPMPWSPRRKIALALGIAFVCFVVGVVVWRNTAGINGEVFIVTDNGKAIVMPGASVRLLKLGESQASKIMSDLGKKFEAYTSEIDEHMKAVRSPDEPTMAHVKFLNNVSAQKYCFQLQSLGRGVQGEFIGGNAGRDGRFSLSATPGTYLLQVSGQAGDTHGEWFQIVRIGWREQLRLVEPTCSYSQRE
jgi:hypothetical protein